ncbi:MAG: hypothetical protein CME05_09435 [Gemmatimonadaceae bacterium]|nr:hypothetical protein [Gemmatimonadaceae bacterium]
MLLEKQMDPRPLRILQAAVLALAAAVLQQIVHESTHGFVALAVGKHWDMLNLFASGTSWPGEPIPSGDGWVAGSAAIVDIIAGGVGLLLLNHAPSSLDRDGVRLSSTMPPSAGSPGSDICSSMPSSSVLVGATSAIGAR